MELSSSPRGILTSRKPESLADILIVPQDHIIARIKNGGKGRSRTCGVSNVTDLQSAAIATMLTFPFCMLRFSDPYFV